MNCTNCGALLLTEYKFCPQCGHSKINTPTKPVTRQPKYETCVLQAIVEQTTPKSFLEKIGRAADPYGDQWIVVVAKHLSSGKEIIRAQYAANLYTYFHGNPKGIAGVKQTIENGKTQVWKFLESNGWEFQNSQDSQFMPTCFFRRQISTS